jgi:uncharacterized protein (DUF433 family)
MESPVQIDSGVMSGAPVFRGTRVPIQILFDHIETGETIEEFLEGFPSVKREQVIDLLTLVARRVPELAT